MDLTKELQEAIRMSWEDEDWLQTLDYKQIPFRCQRCHEHGHLIRDCTMNIPKPTTRKEMENQDQGFTRVSSWKKGGRKQDKHEVNKNILVSNQFGALEYLLEETPAKYPKVKKGDQPHQDTMETPTNMGEKATKDKHQDNMDWDTGDEVEDMDIKRSRPGRIWVGLCRCGKMICHARESGSVKGIHSQGKGDK